MLSRLSRTFARRSMFGGAMNAHTMTPEQIKLVKATAPVFQQLGVKITTTFYNNIFADHPSLKNIFNQAHQRTGTQPTALANAVFAYAANIDNLGALGSAVSRMGHKHASLNIAPEQYPIVGQYLLQAVKQVLGDGIDDKTVEAWKVAYGQLADIMIGYEADLYNKAAALPGGWKGWRKFRVADKKAEANGIISFTLEPVDKGAVPQFQPGQFISVKRFVPELGYEQPRQYSLSAAPSANGKAFRITVKRETGSPNGVISNIMHDNVKVGDEIDVTPPFGDFVLDASARTPAVLMSGGIGLTPMLSMLETILTQSPADRKVAFVHAVRDYSHHAMRQYLQNTARAYADRMTASVWYEDGSKGGVIGTDFHHTGRINIEKIRDQVLLPNADYYLCGPIGFMADMQAQLVRLGVPKNKIHSEVFGSDSR